MGITKVINKSSRIYIAGHNGMVGSALLRLFKKKKYKNIIIRTRKQLNLLDQKKTYSFLKNYKPDIVIIAAAKVGGINANNIYRGDFLYENIQIQNNLIHGSYLANIKKLIFLGSSCIYPKICKQPIKEEYLLNGPLEPTNEPYAIAKIAGLKMIESYNNQFNLNYLCLMPCNLYGPNDNYDLKNSHFIPALIRKIHEAKINKKNYISIWGDGTPKREVMHVDDLANACFYFMNKKIKHDFINIGTGEEYSILSFTKILFKILDFNGVINFDKTKPNGTPRKILDTKKANKLGWNPAISFKIGAKKVYDEYKSKFK